MLFVKAKAKGDEKFPVRVSVLERVVHAIGIPVEALRAARVLNKVVHREEGAGDGIIDAPVHVDEPEGHHVLVSGESPVEGERSPGLPGVPGGEAHAVAPGVEVGLLHGVLVPVEHLLPPAEVVGEHIVEVFVPTLVDMHGNDLNFGVDIVEPTGSGGCGIQLIKVGDPGLFLDKSLPVGNHRTSFMDNKPCNRFSLANPLLMLEDQLFLKYYKQYIMNLEPYIY